MLACLYKYKPIIKLLALDLEEEQHAQKHKGYRF